MAEGDVLPEDVRAGDGAPVAEVLGLDREQVAIHGHQCGYKGMPVALEEERILGSPDVVLVRAPRLLGPTGAQVHRLGRRPLVEGGSVSELALGL